MCVRYVRTNTSKDNYIRTVHLFETRLQARNYPPEFVNKTTALVLYDNRQKYLQQSKPERAKTWLPLFKCIPPPVSSAKADYFTRLFHGPKICTTPAIHSSTTENTKPGTRKSTNKANR